MDQYTTKPVPVHPLSCFHMKSRKYYLLRGIPMPVIILPEPVKRIIHTLEAGGFSAWAVGGCVRDALLNTSPTDWDVATSAQPHAVLKAFSGLPTIQTGITHGTVSVIVEGVPYEVTTYRRDGAYTDHRHPDQVRFLTEIEGDLARRDFTINAMAYHPERGLVDPFHGAADLSARLIRCVGDPDQRFKEDGLRLLRALRFASRLRFTLEPATSASLHSNKRLLVHIAPERIQKELNGILLGSGAADVLRAYGDVAGVILPELIPCFGFDQHNPHHQYDVWEHTLHALEATPQSLIPRLAILLHDIGKPACFSLGPDGIGHFYGHQQLSRAISQQILERLRYPTKVLQTVLTLVSLHDVPLPPTRAAILRRLHQMGPETFLNLLLIKQADALAHADASCKLSELKRAGALFRSLLAENACFSCKDLAIDGNDLLRLGFPQGPPVGQTLRQLLGEVMDGRLSNEKHALTARALELLPKEAPSLPAF